MKNLVVLCVILSFVPAVNADVLIGDFEGTLDGWVPGSGINASFSTGGVTRGNYSLRLAGSVGWYNDLIVADLGENPIANFWANSIMTVDVTIFQDEWIPDTTIGWTSSPSIKLIVNPGSGQWLDLGEEQLYNPIQGDSTTTLSWNYSAAKPQNPPIGPVMFSLVYMDYGYVGPSVFYLDNAWLKTPEPATLALLGLGGLALLRRKR